MLFVVASEGLNEGYIRLASVIKWHKLHCRRLTILRHASECSNWKQVLST